MVEQKRLDRPDREETARQLIKLNRGKAGIDRPELREKMAEFEERVRCNQNNPATCPSWKVDEARKEILALIPDIGEAKKQERERIVELYIRHHETQSPKDMRRIMLEGGKNNDRKDSS